MHYAQTQPQGRETRSNYRFQEAPRFSSPSPALRLKICSFGVDRRKQYLLYLRLVKDPKKMYRVLPHSHLSLLSSVVTQALGGGRPSAGRWGRKVFQTWCIAAAVLTETLKSTLKRSRVGCEKSRSSAGRLGTQIHQGPLASACLGGRAYWINRKGILSRTEV